MMEPVSIQLPPVMPETFYEHNTGYHGYSGPTSSLWPNRDDSMRTYLTQGPEFESHIRHTGFLPRRTGISNATPANSESTETENNSKHIYSFLYRRILASFSSKIPLR